MKKIILSELDLHYGEIKMPKNFEIDNQQLKKDISYFKNNPTKDFPFSRAWNMLNTYLIEHIFLYHNFHLINKKTFGTIINPKCFSKSFLQINPIDLINSPDYVMLYGVDIEKNSCQVFIEYDDNRRKGNSWTIPLNSNNFIMFPSVLRFHIMENTSKQDNYILATTYNYVKD